MPLDKINLLESHELSFFDPLKISLGGEKKRDKLSYAAHVPTSYFSIFNEIGQRYLCLILVRRFFVFNVCDDKPISFGNCLFLIFARNVKHFVDDDAMTTVSRVLPYIGNQPFFLFAFSSYPVFSFSQFTNR